MADEKSGGGEKPSGSLKHMSGIRFEATKPATRAIDMDDELRELIEKQSRRAEAKEPATGWSWRKVLGLGAFGAAAVAGGFASGPVTEHVHIIPSATDSVINAIADGWASTSQLGSPQEKAKAEVLLRSALSEAWSECEGLAKEITQDALKEVVETGASALVLRQMLNPLLRRLKAAPHNPVVAEAAGALQKIANKLGDEPAAKLDERNVVRWTEVTPEQAQLLLRALKLHEVDGHWLLETNQLALNVALSVARKG